MARPPVPEIAPWKLPPLLTVSVAEPRVTLPLALSCAIVLSKLLRSSVPPTVTALDAEKALVAPACYPMRCGL